MIANITGDLVQSAKSPTDMWMAVLRRFLNKQGKAAKELGYLPELNINNPECNSGITPATLHQP